MNPPVSRFCALPADYSASEVLKSRHRGLFYFLICWYDDFDGFDDAEMYWDDYH